MQEKMGFSNGRAIQVTLLLPWNGSVFMVSNLLFCLAKTTTPLLSALKPSHSFVEEHKITRLRFVVLFVLFDNWFVSDWQMMGLCPSRLMKTMNILLSLGISTVTDWRYGGLSQQVMKYCRNSFFTDNGFNAWNRRNNIAQFDAVDILGWPDLDTYLEHFEDGILL